MTAPGPTFAGRRVLVVEDDFVIAMDMAAGLSDAGGVVSGPVATVADARALLDAGEAIDGAVLDVNLGGETVFSLAAMLRQRGIPMVFATGYDRGAIPAEFGDVPICEKPMDIGTCARLLFGSRKAT